MSGVLVDRISVGSRFARSANVERDIARLEPLDGYVITARVLDCIERIATTATYGQAGGAWSLTGPYGSGKSSLALLIDAAFGPATPTREAALRLIGEASVEVESTIVAAHKRHGTWKTGFRRGLVTASREPISATVLRALQTAHERGSASGAGRAVDPLLVAHGDDLTRPRPNPSSIVQLARSLATEAPLLIVVDEFGKSLEAVGDGLEDPYLLQQLAEAGQGSGLPIFLVTLQHLSFEDHLAGGGEPERREWAKVQGRFEDVPFVESAGQVRALIGSVFDARDAAFERRIARWAAHQTRTMQSLGIAELADPRAVASCYPMHPLAVMVLPELCSRYGQHERTLFTFLTGQHPAGVRRFLTATAVPARGLLPSVGLASVYDYFVGHGAIAGLSGRSSRRWSEIATRLQDATDLSERQTRMAKRIAIMNLITTTGIVRASRALLSVTDPHADRLLADLEAEGIATFRDFADEYRIWQGTDVDVGRLIEDSRLRIRQRRLVEVMGELNAPLPAVAARHSAQYDVLRAFTQRYADAADPVDPVDPFSVYDGEVLLVVDSTDVIPVLSGREASAKPIVAAIPREVARIDAVAREVLAIRQCAREPLVEGDWVARRELAERLAQAEVALEAALHQTFRTDTCRWFLLEPSEPRDLPTGRGSRALSRAADLAFQYTPLIRNEVLNRTQLTSQGAKARRLLLGAMIERGGEVDLGLEGYGPEMAMYRAFVKRLHDATAANPFGAPPSADSLSHAWEVIEAQFARAKTGRVNLKRLYEVLLSGPIGMKEGAIPVFLTASLLAYRDRIAIYEHGTFRPLLAAEVSERMVRNPHHFDVKHFANTTGARRNVVNALAESLGVRPLFGDYRVANVLAIAGHLVSTIRRLDNFTLRTRSLSPEALAVRTAVTTAVEPDELLFDSLPKSLGLPPVAADMGRYGDQASYAESLSAAMEEITGRYSGLEHELRQQLLRTAAERSRLAVSGQAAALDGEVLDRSVRAFVLALRGDAAKTDSDWIRTIATVVSGKAPTEWTDRDLTRFRHQLRVQIATFQRLVALHAVGRAGGSGPFRALRVTITRPDGLEHDRLVGVDERDRPLTERALDDLITRLERDLGSPEQAEKALLACLGERLLPVPNRGDERAKSVTNPRNRRHG